MTDQDRRKARRAKRVDVSAKDAEPTGSSHSGPARKSDKNVTPATRRGSVSRTGATSRRVAEARTMAQALRESEEKYRTLVESAGEAIATLDSHGRVLFMNKTGATRLGGTPADYIGKTMWDLFPPTIADRQVASIRKVIATGKGINVVVPTEVQGQQRWYNTTIEPIRDATGNVTAALVVGRDIHELRQARLELEQYQEKMSRAEQLASLGALSATIAHELTQPLTVSRLSVQEAIAQLESTDCAPAVMETLREGLAGISDAVRRVEQFRALTRQSSKEPAREVWLRDVVQRVVRLLHGNARERRLSLCMRGLKNLPPLHINEKDVEQMCFALIENAIHAADGREERRLVIHGRTANRQIALRFEDDCGGIAAEHVDKIFHPFFTTKPPGLGTGLGLCIVRRVVAQAHGDIRVDNRPGQGVTFCITLPTHKPPSQQPAPTQWNGRILE